MRLQHNIHLTQNQYSFQNKPNQQNKTKIIDQNREIEVSKTKLRG